MGKYLLKGTLSERTYRNISRYLQNGEDGISKLDYQNPSNLFSAVEFLHSLADPAFVSVRNNNDWGANHNGEPKEVYDLLPTYVGGLHNSFAVKADQNDIGVLSFPLKNANMSQLFPFVEHNLGSNLQEIAALFSNAFNINITNKSNAVTSLDVKQSFLCKPAKLIKKVLKFPANLKQKLSRKSSDLSTIGSTLKLSLGKFEGKRTKLILTDKINGKALTQAEKVVALVNYYSQKANTQLAKKVRKTSAALKSDEKNKIIYASQILTNIFVCLALDMGKENHRQVDNALRLELSNVLASIESDDLKVTKTISKLAEISTDSILKKLGLDKTQIIQHRAELGIHYKQQPQDLHDAMFGATINTNFKQVPTEVVENGKKNIVNQIIYDGNSSLFDKICKKYQAPVADLDQGMGMTVPEPQPAPSLIPPEPQTPPPAPTPIQQGLTPPQPVQDPIIEDEPEEEPQPIIPPAPVSSQPQPITTSEPATEPEPVVIDQPEAVVESQPQPTVGPAEPQPNGTELLDSLIKHEPTPNPNAAPLMPGYDPRVARSAATEKPAQPQKASTEDKIHEIDENIFNVARFMLEMQQETENKILTWDDVKVEEGAAKQIESLMKEKDALLGIKRTEEHLTRTVNEFFESVGILYRLDERKVINAPESFEKWLKNKSYTPLQDFMDIPFTEDNQKWLELNEYILQNGGYAKNPKETKELKDLLLGIIETEHQLKQHLGSMQSGIRTQTEKTFERILSKADEYEENPVLSKLYQEKEALESLQDEIWGNPPFSDKDLATLKNIEQKLRSVENQIEKITKAKPKTTEPKNIALDNDPEIAKLQKKREKLLDVQDALFKSAPFTAKQTKQLEKIEQELEDIENKINELKSKGQQVAGSKQDPKPQPAPQPASTPKLDVPQNLQNPINDEVLKQIDKYSQRIAVLEQTINDAITKKAEVSKKTSSNPEVITAEIAKLDKHIENCITEIRLLEEEIYLLINILRNQDKLFSNPKQNPQPDQNSSAEILKKLQEGVSHAQTLKQKLSVTSELQPKQDNKEVLSKLEQAVKNAQTLKQAVSRKSGSQPSIAENIPQEEKTPEEVVITRKGDKPTPAPRTRKSARKIVEEIQVQEKIIEAVQNAQNLKKLISENNEKLGLNSAVEEILKDIEEAVINAQRLKQALAQNLSPKPEVSESQTKPTQETEIIDAEVINPEVLVGTQYSEEQPQPNKSNPEILEKLEEAIIRAKVLQQKIIENSKPKTNNTEQDNQADYWVNGKKLAGQKNKKKSSVQQTITNPQENNPNQEPEETNDQPNVALIPENTEKTAKINKKKNRNPVLKPNESVIFVGGVQETTETEEINERTRKTIEIINHKTSKHSTQTKKSTKTPKPTASRRQADRTPEEQERMRRQWKAQYERRKQRQAQKKLEEEATAQEQSSVTITETAEKNSKKTKNTKNTSLTVLNNNSVLDVPNIVDLASDSNNSTFMAEINGKLCIITITVIDGQAKSAYYDVEREQ